MAACGDPLKSGPLVMLVCGPKRNQIMKGKRYTTEDKIRILRTARMGVVQVNPMYSTATTWEGNNATSTLDKTITVTVNAEFALN
jgi:hypothetical protein